MFMGHEWLVGIERQELASDLVPAIGWDQIEQIAADQAFLALSKYSQ